MDKFKFTKKEWEQIEHLVDDYALNGIVTNESTSILIAAIETLISSRADGWVKVEEVPTDKNIMKQADIFTEDEEGPYSRYSAFIAGAKWMESKLIPQPPKTAQQ